MKRTTTTRPAVKLQIKKDTVRELTRSQLTKVVGAGSGISCSCQPSNASLDPPGGI